MTTNFFDESSPYLAHPLLTDERSSEEVDRILGVLDLRRGARILDIGCGFGRHCVELAHRGLEPMGIDPSATMRGAAADRVGQRGFEVSFSAELNESHQGADGAIAMFTTIGQVGPTGDSNESLVADVRGALRPGAGLIIEVPQRDIAVDLLVPEETFGAGANRTEVTRSFDSDTGRVAERFVVTTDGVDKTFDLAYRLFDRDEMGALLADAGFGDVRFAPDLAGLLDQTALQASDPTMVVVATVRD